MSELAIRNVDDLMQLSKVTAVSSLLPTSLRGKPADVAIILMYGAELGLGPGQALQGIYVVNGRPSLAAQTWLALARRAKHKVAVLEHTDEKCVVEITRGDTEEKHVSSYTYAEAEKAKLTGKDVWKQHTKAMLLARAVSQGCRFICPEIALGFYAEGELDEEEPATEPVRLASEIIRPADAPEEEPVDAEQIQAEIGQLVADYEGGEER